MVIHSTSPKISPLTNFPKTLTQLPHKSHLKSKTSPKLSPNFPISLTPICVTN